MIPLVSILALNEVYGVCSSAGEVRWITDFKAAKLVGPLFPALYYMILHNWNIY